MPHPYGLYPGWLSREDVLPALREAFTYDSRDPQRATGWLYAGRQIGQLPETSWPQSLAAQGGWLLDALEDELGTRFDAACFQAYLDGSGCGWHYDRDWDAQAIISLGVTRAFGLRTSEDDEIFLELGHGDMLFMPPGFQDEWEHCVPVQDDTPGERCSLVFRSAPH